ncbi:hypothetical protein [Roseateles sp. P5_D6]
MENKGRIGILFKQIKDLAMQLFSKHANRYLMALCRSSEESPGRGRAASEKSTT